MKYQLIIKEEAYIDLQVAYDYYEEQSSGLGDDFLEKIKERLAYIKQYPFHFIKIEKDYRQALTDRFPYLILYEIIGREIIVYAIFHGKRNPAKKIPK